MHRARVTLAPCLLALWLLTALQPDRASANCVAPDPAVPSYILNAQVIDLLFQVNAGPQAQVPGTDAARRWQPTSTTLAFDPLCRPRGALRWGTNEIAILPAEGSAPASRFVFVIPDGTNVLTQFQLYVVWNGNTAFKMLVLGDGLFLALVDPI